MILKIGVSEGTKSASSSKEQMLGNEVPGIPPNPSPAPSFKLKSNHRIPAAPTDIGGAGSPSRVGKWPRSFRHEANIINIDPPAKLDIHGPRQYSV